ncbi:acetylglutamate kinase [Candidatus Contubernalis alkaliaceticus]|uniref:acetylglutamate kinase n=1 Tax=Candidatus Contubernalis alkaliaceticus TaxID=338645 RepID=UPI001F4C51D3|nr:acetylglutamate kinase [Candidatus Contubernalis alkalaceticus]UNC91487.1 acetylglutamate kinase [Candidatus Contubernalis alkalaceticus]
MQEIIKKAEVLVEALPYIRAFADKTLVIKYGGQAMVNDELKKSVIIDIILLKYIGLNPILVHGGGAEVTRLMEKVGKEAEFVNGLRVTDKETIELVEMVLVGKINKEIVGLINQYGGKAVGLSGKDSNLIIAQKRPPESMVVEGEERIVDLGYVGDIVQINPEVINILSAQGYIPVISTLGVNLNGESLNINADHVAGEMAAALGAEKLMILTDVEGIFEDPKDTSSLIATLPRAQAIEMIERAKISQGMIPKVQACLKALEHEVRRTHIVDGRMPHSLLLEIFTDHGIGTMVIE